MASREVEKSNGAGILRLSISLQVSSLVTAAPDDIVSPAWVGKGGEEPKGHRVAGPALSHLLPGAVFSGAQEKVEWLRPS